jgi:hypothetical protein
MAAWTLTKNGIQKRVETKIRALRGRAEITAEERFSIFDAINEAIIDLSIERGLDAPKIITSHTTLTTVADQNYVDLPSTAIQVVDGTVRIISEGQILTPFFGDLASFYAFDPRENFSSSFPTRYAMDTDGSGTLRMRLRSTPDQAYTIDLDIESVPDEDSVSTFPGWYHPALRSLSTAIALDNLGLDGRSDQARYNERLKNIREKMRGRSGPQHIQLRERQVRPRAPELRATF